MPHHPIAFAHNPCCSQVCGLIGVLQAQKELVSAFFFYNVIAIVYVFHSFVDVCTDLGIR